jgi:hypothetical protein
METNDLHPLKASLPTDVTANPLILLGIVTSLGSPDTDATVKPVEL